ncbi:MAG: hypothetical protein IKP43_10720 [Bacteroidaceae bacterium]|nr:hypothetical protein [Bacteroidaceae bacterium]
MNAELESIFNKLRQASNDDLPQTVRSIFKEAKDKLLSQHDHQSLCALLNYCSLYLRYEVQTAAEEAIDISTQDGNKAMTAIYHFFAGMDNYDSENEHINQALSDPEYLASVHIDDWDWIERGDDSKSIFNNDLLSFIGLQTKRYDVLYNYYKQTDNRKATCYSLIEMIIDTDTNLWCYPNHFNNVTYNKLTEAIRQYDDLSLVCRAVEYICKNNLLPRSKKTGLEAENENAERKYHFLKPYADKFKGDPYSKGLDSLIHQLGLPTFKSKDFDQVVVPEHSFTIPLTLRNVKDLTVSIYPTKFDGKDVHKYEENYKYRHDDLKSKISKYLSPAVYSKTYHYSNDKPYITKECQVEVGGLPLGIYIIELKNDRGETDVAFLHVSKTMAINETLPDDKIRIVVVDNLTGHPVPFAKVDVFSDSSKEKVITTIKCNYKGEVIYDYKKNDKRPKAFFPYTEDDAFGYIEDVRDWGYSYQDEKDEECIDILTDRAIYRPGQTVHGAIVSYHVNRQKGVNTVRERVTVELWKNYNKCIAESTATTDQFGVAHFDFVIPEDADTGSYTIECYGTEKSILVEEYKRPTFKVKFEEYTQPYKLGETISVEGIATSYSGVPVSNAKVKYRIKRAAAWWWMFMNQYWEVGGFHGRYSERAYFTRETTTNDKGHFFIDVPMQLPYESGSHPVFMDIIAEVDVVDTTGEMQSAQTRFPLSNKDYYMGIQMEEQIEISDEHSFTVAVKNASGQDLDKEIHYWFDDSPEVKTMPSNQQVTLLPLAIGKHTLHAKLDEEELTHEFLVLDKYANQTPYETEKWSYQSAEVFSENGDEVIIQIGCNEEDSYIVYNLYADDKVIETGAQLVFSGMINMRLTYKKEYGNALLLSFAWVRNKKMQTENFTITRPIPKRELQLSWETFRNRVTPGTEETWVLTVKDKEGKNVSANVIAMLYDKSLDQLAKNSWDFGPTLSWNVPHADWDYESIPVASLKYLIIYYPEQVHFDFNRPNQLVLENESRMSDDECYMSMDSDYADSDVQFCESKRPIVLDSEPEVQLRSDMSETAFFMPQLRTDKDGSVRIEFRLPDSLTTWKFRAIAHTHDLFYSLFEDETVARKAVMVQPNMPRFVRVGDETTISAKIINTAGKEISGKIVFELLDASDEKTVFKESKPFTLAEQGIVAESFHFNPDEEITDYICKVYAIGDGFSDGEQHSLPVLPNKTEVTVTRVITQDGAGTENIDTAALLPDGTTRRRLSFQYTNSPVWLAVKALPAMVDKEAKNAISVSVSLYCNMLTDYLLKNVGKYGTVVTADSDALQKTTKKLIQRLKKLQGSGGGFKWYRDMDESFYMTTEILMHLCRLQKFTGKTKDIKDIIKKAFRFCDKKMCKKIEDLKKWVAKGHKIYLPSFSMLQHMYNCAISGHQLSKKGEQAYRYLIPLLKKDIHEQTMMEKAMSTIILEYAGDHERAMTYAESLRQYTKNDDNRGRTFQTSRASYSWYSYKIPTHVAGMEALYLLCPEDKKTYREMQKWLLNEKRTQMWETPIDCVNAVHALLLDAEDYLSKQNPAEFFTDETPLVVNSFGNEGYVESDIPVTSGNFSIVKTSKGMSWGAVYARFLQPMADVESSGSGMTIQREIITDKEELHVGDRIKVRLTYTCDRNYDLVTVIDSKAACMEPIEQLSWSDSFKFVEPRDKEVRYHYYGLSEGTHSIVTEYYLDRPGVYEIGLATIVCTYAPEFRATCPSQKIRVLE